MNHVKFYQASSSEMFGSNYDTDRNGSKYQDEDTKLMPQSPYAIAKCCCSSLPFVYIAMLTAFMLAAGILFNHEGPRRGENFVTQKIVQWIANYTKWLGTLQLIIVSLIFTDDNITLNRESFPKLRLGNLRCLQRLGICWRLCRSNVVNVTTRSSRRLCNMHR
jgi:hypothetical protein